jgi:adenylate cyclase
MDVEAIPRMLNFYLQEMSEVILEENGTLDKYIGDSIMSFWNAPTIQADHARRACRAALAMRRREEKVAEELEKLAGGVIYSRVGINSGPMIVGNMGSSSKFNYTVLGDAVNLGSRLESANKLYGTRALVSEGTAALVRDAFVLRKVDLIRVKGKQRPMEIYELLVEGIEPPAEISGLIAKYERALVHYQASRFDEAYEVLQSLLADYPTDGPAGTLLRRIEQYRVSPPPAGWDGVYVAKDK